MSLLLEGVILRRGRMTPHQLSFPDIPASPPPVRTRHRYGPPSGMYGVCQCRSCPVLRRYGPFGSRGGYGHQRRLDGEWSDVEIPCATKRRG